MKTDSQNNLIKAWLMNGRSITPLQALDMFGCFRLSARIDNLRKAGMNIKTDLIMINDKRIAQYSIPR
jgi:hypothetical protein